MAKAKEKLISTKCNNLIDAGFFKKLNSMEMRIFNLAVSRLNPMRKTEQNKRFEFTVKEFLDFNSAITDHNNVYDNVKSAVLNLGKIWVEVEPMEGYDKTEISLLTRRSYAKGKGSFMIEFHEDVIPYLAEIKNNFTSMLLETFGSLKSEYSLKFYEMFSRWAYQKSMQISFSDLRELLNVGNKYQRYNNFNLRVLTPALEEINAKTNLLVTVEPIRKGRNIAELKFSIFDKSKAIKIEQTRPKFPHKNKYGRYVKLDHQNPKMSSAEYGNYAKDCLKILEDFYGKIEDVTKEDLLFYWVFLSVNASNKSKLGGKKIFTDELKKRGFKIVECALVKI